MNIKLIFIIAFLFVFNITINNAYSDSKNSSDLDCNKTELINRINLIRSNKTKANFIIIDKNTLKIEGYIVPGSYNNYKNVINNNIKTLIINSGGGSVTDSIKIAMDILDRKIDVVVDGIAVSSAANYLFLSGNKKIIKNGFVGFHGNAQAALNQKDFELIRKEMKDQAKIPENIFEKVFENFKQETLSSIKLEKEFYSRINVSQKLFDFTQNPNKGLESELGFEFDILIPSLSTMEKYGIKNIQGKSDLNFAEFLGAKFIYF